MILVCDECKSRYLVPGHAIGPEGRQVRCTNCSYEWFQEGEQAQGPEDDFGDRPEEELPNPDDIEPIPESVKPMPEGSNVPALPGDESGKKKEWVGKYVGYAAAASVFLAVAGGLLLAKGVMVKSWPPSLALHDLVGMETAVEGEDLIFDQLSAVSRADEDGIQTLTVKADILNLARKESIVPAVQASLITEQGEVVDSWLVQPDHDTLEGEGEMPFETSYPQVPPDVREVNVRFIVGEELRTVKTETKSATWPEEEHVPEEHEEEHEAMPEAVPEEGHAEDHGEGHATDHAEEAHH